MPNFNIFPFNHFNRNNIYPQTRGDWIGFRVVRELPSKG